MINTSLNDHLPFNKVNSKVNCDKNKHADDSKTKKLKNIPTIDIIGDSHLNVINPKGLPNTNNVAVRYHPGCTTQDLTSCSDN